MYFDMQESIGVVTSYYGTMYTSANYGQTWQAKYSGIPGYSFYVDVASGFIGQYAHGNEPSHYAAYLYDYAGPPWKTQFYVNKVLQEQYDDQRAGYTGNEDCGQMSSWYIFSAMLLPG